MSDSVARFRIIILGILLILSILVWWPQNVIRANQEEQLKVRFLDVGQGDAIHIVTPDGYEMLIDGGPTNSVLQALSENRSFFDKEIDVVVATHPDTDHVAGLVDVFKRFKVDYILETNAKSDAPAAVAYCDNARAEGARIITAEAGQTLQLGASTTIYIFSPHGDTSEWETNTASIVVQVVYGDTSFMLTGDAPSSIEEYLVDQYGTALESDVLKLGHHGSKTSSSEEFLKVVNPEYAVVSAEANSRYGHPHQEVVDRVLENNIEILNTAKEGTIEFLSDGNRVWLNN